MIRHNLPPCRWRGRSTTPGMYECRSHQAQLAGSEATIRECLECPVRDHEPAGEPGPAVEHAGQVRHLAYHVYPLGEEWRDNMYQLRQRMSLFNGRRIVSVAADSRTACPTDVAAELAGCDCEIREVPNDPALREMASYPGLMRSLSVYRGPADCHWYGHAKGASSASWAPAVRDWREAMYQAQLDYWPLIADLLHSYCCVGQYMRPRHIIEGSPCRWHFSGTFSWRRHSPLFERDWDSYDQHWCGSESHLGRIYRSGEVYSLYGDRPPRGLDLYLEEVWAGGLRQQHRRWCEEHAAQRQDPLLCTVILTAARQRDLVHESIASVRAQTTDSWQLLVVDAGELAAEGAYDRYASDARVSVMTTGETAAQRRSLGIQGWAINEAWRRGRVRGDLVVCLCDDDTLDPGWLSQVLGAARAHPDQSAWYGQAERWAVAGDGRQQLLGVLDAEGDAGPDLPLRGRIDGMQLCCRRSAWMPWPEDRRRRREADGYWMDSIAVKTIVRRLAALAGRHRHTPLSTFTTPAGPAGVEC